MQAVGSAVTAQVVMHVARARQGPLVLVPPGVRAHHKQAHRRLLADAVVHAFEPAVEPAQVQAV